MLEATTTITSLTIELATKALGPRLTAIYSIGSLARGAFRPLVSDIDIGLVLSGSLLETDSPSVESVRAAIITSGRNLAERISLFWGTPESMNAGSGGRFPAADRSDLIRHGQLLHGTDIRSLLIPPSAQQLIVEGATFAMEKLRTRENMDRLRAPALLMSAGPLLLTKLVLFPVRLMYTLHIGAIGNNDVAVAHYLETTQGGRSELVAAGLAWRSAPAAPGNEHALRLLREHLVPLYQEMITEHVLHPALEEHDDLVRELITWHTELG